MKKRNDIELEYGKPITFIDGLQLLFIGLKLAKIISWNWFCVLLPFILSAITALIFAIVFYKINKNK